MRQSDPPFITEQFITSCQAIDVAITGRSAILTDSCGRLRMVEVSDPSRPKDLGGPTLAGPAYKLRVNGGLAYAIGPDPALQVLDIFDPARPRVVGTYKGTLAPRDMVVDRDHAYIATYDGVTILNLAAPSRPVLVAHWTSAVPIQNVRIFESYLLLLGGDRIQIVDVHDPAHPKKVSEFSKPHMDAEGAVHCTPLVTR